MLNKLGVGVRDGHHLREIDESDLVGVVDHQIELVEVTVDQPVARQPQYQVHQLVVNLCYFAHVREIIFAHLFVNNRLELEQIKNKMYKISDDKSKIKKLHFDLTQGWATYGPRARSGPPSKHFWPATCF